MSSVSSRSRFLAINDPVEDEGGVKIHLPDVSDDAPLLIDTKYESTTGYRNYGTDGKPVDATVPEDPRSMLERAEAVVTDHVLGATIFYGLLLVNAVLFFHGCAVGYDAAFTPPDTWLRPLGRGAGEVLNLNCALVLVPMCHALWFFLQGTWIGSVLPSERLLFLHKFFAWVIVVATVVHGAVGFRILAQVLGTPTWPGGWGGFAQVFITGCVVTAVLVVLVLTSRGCVRRGRHFELFWVSHHLFIVFEIGMLLHGFQFGRAEYWKYALGPWLLYAADRVYRACSGGGRGVPCRVLAGQVYAGAVRVELARPPTFHFRAGMYVTLCCEAVSRTEWHAFTIVSAPSDPTLLFCIKVTGDWTARLRELVAERGAAGLEMRVRGPFGAPTAFAHQFEHVTLVGGGIGATPFVSVLKEMVAELYSPTAAAQAAAAAAAAGSISAGAAAGGERGGRAGAVTVPRALQRALEQQEEDARRGVLGASWEASLLSVSNLGSKVSALDPSQAHAQPIVAAAAELYASRYSSRGLPTAPQGATTSAAVPIPGSPTARTGLLPHAAAGTPSAPGVGVFASRGGVFASRGGVFASRGGMFASRGGLFASARGTAPAALAASRLRSRGSAVAAAAADGSGGSPPLPTRYVSVRRGDGGAFDTVASRLLRVGGDGDRASVVAQVADELVAPPSRRVALASQASALLLSMLVQASALWLFMLLFAALAVQFVLVLPVYGAVPTLALDLHVAGSLLLGGLQLCAFVAELLAAPRTTATSGRVWLELLLLPVPLAITALVVLSGQLQHQLAQLLLWVCAAVAALGFALRMQRVLGRRVYFQPRVGARRNLLRTVNFVWVCSQLSEVDWLAPELVALERADTRNLLNIRVHITRAPAAGTLPGLGLRHALVAGRPDWAVELLEGAKTMPSGGVMGVFFCGPPSMGQAVRAAAAEATARTMHLDEKDMILVAQTRFLFHREVF